jgi:hypothetical protein
MLAFYRVEHEENGKGMHTSGASCQFQIDSGRHPLPKNDSLISDWYYENFTPDYFFAFASLEQMRAWVYSDAWVDHLHTEGFVINVYQTDDGVHGHSQAIFRKETATLIETISLEDV